MEEAGQPPQEAAVIHPAQRPVPLHIVLFRPEIPQNTGNVGRLCAFTGARLHLLKPLGFAISDRHLRRAGMDYWHSLDLWIHESWEDFLASPAAPSADRLWLLTTHGPSSYWAVQFRAGDGLVFGNEGSGAPDWLHRWFGDERRLLIPRGAGTPALRSLNLSTAVGIGVYEAMRQIGGCG